MISSFISSRLLAGALAVGFSLPLSAQVLMLDFGGTTVSGADLTNSPYHTENPSFTDTVWNKQGQGSDSTFTWSDGTTATDVAYTTFKNPSGGSTTMDTAGWSASVNGSAVNTGVYASPSVGFDGYMMTSTFSNQRAIGFQMTGLPEGDYEIYFVGRNTNEAALNYTLNYYAAAVGSTSTSFNFSAYDSASLSFADSATDKVSSWVYDSGDPSASNYTKMSVSITASNPVLNVATMGVGVNGVFNAIQIVAVPEPSTYALIGGFVCLVGVVAMRRRRK